VALGFNMSRYVVCETGKNRNIDLKFEAEKKGTGY
jgi:hypothetical protein